MRWFKKFDHLAKAWLIRRDDGAQTPVVRMPEPMGGRLDENGFNIYNKMNACLIEASPELLEACERIIKIGHGNAPSVGYIMDLIEYLQPIVNKARGL